LLQTHYSDIHQEIVAKTEILKQQRQKIRSLEREIVDIQGEFQLDRADYLDTFRRLEKRNKFYEQFFEKISPVLKRDGKVWNIDFIKSESSWNDDLKKWKIPESLLMHVKLPPAAAPKPDSTESTKSRENTSSTAPARLECLNDPYDSDESADKEKQKDVDIALTYFRPKRIEKLIHDSRAWKNDLSQKAFSLPKNSFDETILNKTWFAGSNFFKSQNNNPWNMNLNLNGKNFDQLLMVHLFVYPKHTSKVFRTNDRSSLFLLIDTPSTIAAPPLHRCHITITLMTHFRSTSS
jgi:hypothetical protein